MSSGSASHWKTTGRMIVIDGDFDVRGSIGEEIRRTTAFGLTGRGCDSDVVCRGGVFRRMSALVVPGRGMRSISVIDAEPTPDRR